MNKILNQLADHKNLIKKNTDYLQKSILEIKKIVLRTFKNKGTIYIAGNGGSASDSQHFAAELMGRYKKNRKPYKAISLASDISTITCIANDFGYENIFSRQLEALGKKNDLVIVFSTSGNSKNIINLLKISKKKKIFSISLLGNRGGKSKKICDYPVIVDSINTARIQEIHQIIYHNVCNLLE